MKYSSGEEMQIGDRVLIEKGSTQGAVNAIIDTSEKMAECGLGEMGVMISSKAFGLVFWPLAQVADPVRFVSRGETQKLRNLRA